MRCPSSLNATVVTAPVCPRTGGDTGWPVSAFQTCTPPSASPATTRWPSSLNATVVIAPVCPLIGGVTGWAVSAFHTRTVPFVPPAATSWPLSLKSTLVTGVFCTIGGSTGCPVTAFHTRTLSSALTKATSSPSALNAASVTALVCIIGGPTGWPVSVSHTRTVWSAPPETMRWPSLLNVTSMIAAFDWMIVSVSTRMSAAVNSPPILSGTTRWAARICKSARMSPPPWIPASMAWPWLVSVNPSASRVRSWAVRVSFVAVTKPYTAAADINSATARTARSTSDLFRRTAAYA
jgi:hypothetical protein